MSLTTQCPRCLTAFHVTSEQLREAQGWVRCGVCQEVFGAQAHALPTEGLALDDLPISLRQEAAHHGEPGDAARSPTTPAKAAGVSRQRRKDRGGWLILAALMLLFLGQLGWQQRHRLAAQFPVAAVWLQSACGTDICRFRNIADIAIADSNFSAPDPSHFRLSVAITNQSSMALEAPSLMLALTDSADHVIARRSYKPLQWGSGTLGAQTTRPVVLWIKFDPPADSEPIVGYRLKAFYP